MACHGWSHYCNECEKKSLLHRSIFSAFIQILSDSFFVRQILSNSIINFKYFILIHLYTLRQHFKLAANCFDKNIWGEYNSSWLYILYVLNHRNHFNSINRENLNIYHPIQAFRMLEMVLYSVHVGNLFEMGMAIIWKFISII